jgi:hypothetical protein
MPELTKPNGESWVTLPPTQEQRKSSGSNFSDWLVDELTALGEAFGEGLTAERQAIYVTALADIPMDQLRQAIRAAIQELKWFPKVAELRELAGALPGTLSDGRPGPEEAWARMPKGRRMEDDSIVWCEEERVAYGVCRSLLLDGDQIGARMAFKERYERELAEARSQRKPAKWTASVGYDIEHRLVTLATAVQEKRVSLEAALNFVPGERQTDFARMLPPAEAKGLLTGEVQRTPNIPGLAGILAKMRMEDSLPEEVRANPRTPHRIPADRSLEEARELREKVNAQREFLKRSRIGSECGRG